MTRFLTTRSHDVGGSVRPAHVVDCDASAGPPFAYAPIADADVQQWVAGGDLVLAIHGFNVPRPHGVGSLAALEAALALPPSYRFMGVLWPGDFWLPVVDYPWEAAHAVQAGKNVAAYADANFAGAASISFVSHSLGARVLLEAIQDMSGKAAQICIAAGAVDDDCFVAQYLKAGQNAARVAVMSSLKDRVLQYAYPAGDFVSDVFLGDNDSPFEQALGRSGPKAPFAPPVFETAIPDADGYDHGDYFPPSSPPDPPAGKWSRAAAFIARAMTGGAIYW